MRRRAPRYAQQKDLNQSAIVIALELVGCSVHVMHTPCDLLVGRVTPEGKRAFLIEVKNPAKNASHKKLTKAQVKFRDKWTGPFAVVETIDQALAAVGATHLDLRKEAPEQFALVG